MLTKPSDDQIRQFIEGTKSASFSYSAQEATKTRTAPAGFTVDHNRALLGEGAEAFEQAANAIRSWQMFNFPWLMLKPESKAIEPGVSVAICANLGVWILNACRIVYVIDDKSDSMTRFGFGYGTLPNHLECGEERFLVEWNHDDDSVYYDIYAFSKPQHPLAKLGFPFTRLGQKQFIKDSKAAMQTAVSSGKCK